MEMMSLSALAATHPLSAVLATIKANSSANARALSDEQYGIIAQHLDEFPKGSVKMLGKTFGARPPRDEAVLTKLALAFPLEMLDNARDLPESVQKMLVADRESRKVIAQSLTNGSLNLSEFKSYDDTFAATLLSVLSGSSYRNAGPLVINLFNTGELEKALKSGAVTPKEAVLLLGNYANVLFKIMTDNDTVRLTQAVVNAQDAEDSLAVKDKLVAIATAQNVKIGAILKTKLTIKQGRPNNNNLAGVTVIPGRTAAPPRGALPQMPATPAPAPAAPALGYSPYDLVDDNFFGDDDDDGPGDSSTYVPAAPATQVSTGVTAQDVAAQNNASKPDAELNDVIGVLMANLLDGANDDITWLDAAKQLREVIMSDPVAADSLPAADEATQLRVILNGMSVPPEQYSTAVLD